MKRLTDVEAIKYGISSVHHEMDNGELRFRLVSENGSSYILTQSTENNGWQKSHVHYKKREVYVVEKGVVLMAQLIDGEAKITKLCENDVVSVPVGIPHNVRMSDGAVLHALKYGAQEEDWNASPELDALLNDILF